MRAAKSICLFFLYSFLMLLLGFWGGVKYMHYFYPGDAPSEPARARLEEDGGWGQSGDFWPEAAEVSQRNETLCVETEYVLEEADILRGTIVETVWRLPGKYVGMNREQFLDAMEVYQKSPPLSELERGFVSLEVLNFSRERVTVQMNYRYLQPGEGYYLAVADHEVVVYLEDKETIYINTGIMLESLPMPVQEEIIQMLYMEDEERLYNFLETYSS